MIMIVLYMLISMFVLCNTVKVFMDDKKKLLVNRKEGNHFMRRGEDVLKNRSFESTQIEDNINNDIIQHINTPFKSVEGYNIYNNYLIPSNNVYHSIVFSFHGMGAHSNDPGQTEYRTKVAKSGKIVFSMDFQGHGKSEGKRNYLSNINNFVLDMNHFIHITLINYPNVPFSLHGISMSGALSLLLANSWDNKSIELRVKNKFLGVAALCPALRVKTPQDYLLSIIRCCCLPFCPASVPSLLSAPPKFRSEERFKIMTSDPLRWQGIPRYVSIDFIFRVFNLAASKIPDYNFPFIVIHGKDDAMVDYKGSEELYNLSKTPLEDKSILLIEGCYHDILNDIAADIAIQSEIKWINKRLDLYYETKK